MKVYRFKEGSVSLDNKQGPNLIEILKVYKTRKRVKGKLDSVIKREIKLSLK